MKQKKWIYVFLSICVLLLLAIQWPVLHAATVGTKGSKIANIDIERVPRDEIQQKLESEIIKWQRKDSILLKGKYEELGIPRTAFTFQIDDTLKDWEEKTNPKWYSFLFKKKNVEQPLNVKFNDEELADLPEYIDKEKLTTELINRAELLSEDSVDVQYLSDQEPSLEEITSTKLDFPESIDSTESKYARELHKILIEPGEEFSLLDHMIDKEIPLSNLFLYEDELDFYATAFYQLVLETDLELVEHHSQGSIPSYSEIGIEARVHPNSKKDLRVYNAGKRTYEIQARIVDPELHLSLNAIPIDNEFEYAIKNEISVNPRTIYRYSQTMAPGQETVIQNGQPGTRLQVVRKQMNRSGELLDEEEIQNISYPAQPKVILASPIDAEEIAEETIDSPLADLEEWMELFYEPKPTEDDIFDEVPEIDNISDLNDIENEGLLPTIDDYVDDLLDTYCEGFDKSESDLEDSIDDSSNESETALENVDDLAEDSLTDKKIQCTRNRDDIREQLKSYLVMEMLLTS